MSTKCKIAKTETTCEPKAVRPRAGSRYGVSELEPHFLRELDAHCRRIDYL